MKAILPIFLLCFVFQLAYAQPPNTVYRYEYPHNDGIPVSRNELRRNELRSRFSEKSVILSFAADARNRQNDVDYEYRQNSNFWYLTGMPDPQAALLMFPGLGVIADGKLCNEVLFVKPRSSQREMWTGVALGVDEGKDILKFKVVKIIDELSKFLLETLKGKDTLWITGLPTAQIKNPVTGAAVYMETDIKKLLQDSFPNLYIKMTTPQLSAMREIKDEDELRLIKKAVEISIEGHTAAIKSARPGIAEYEVEAEMEYAFKKYGAEDVGYPSIVGSNYNACILHYVSNRRKTGSDDLILADCGAEYHNYTADITRTFPVSGKFTREQKIIYDIVLEAQDSGIAASRPGRQFRDPHHAAMAVVKRRLMEEQIIEKPEEAIWYFSHGTSHYLGLDVHDPGTYGVLKPNSVITVEPGIYIPEGSPCAKKWHAIGVRIEDDILITDGAPVNLSEALPRKAEEIENLMKK